MKKHETIHPFYHRENTVVKQKGSALLQTLLQCIGQVLRRHIFFYLGPYFGFYFVSQFGIVSFALVGVPYQYLVFELASPTPPFGVITNGFPHPKETATFFRLANMLEKEHGYLRSMGGVEVVGDNTTQRHGCAMRRPCFFHGTPVHGKL